MSARHIIFKDRFLNETKKHTSINRCRLLGAHMEGPFLCESYSGAHDIESICKPSISALNKKNIYFVKYLSKNKIANNLKMNKPYSFSIDQMNGIVEDTYAKIINECENLKKNTNCPNEQLVALLSVIASNYATKTEKKEN